VPLDVHTCIDLNPEVALTVCHDKLSPFVLKNLPLCPLKDGIIYFEDPVIVPLILILVTFNVP
jgi:hypothetical protein